MNFKFGAIKIELFAPTWSYHTWFSLNEILSFPVVLNWGISINHQLAFYHSVYFTFNRRYAIQKETIISQQSTSHTLKMNSTIYKQKHWPCNAGNVNVWYFSQGKKLQHVHHSILNLWPAWPLQTLLNLILYMIHDLFIHVHLMKYRHPNV
jgi:hypothetical protein